MKKGFDGGSVEEVEFVCAREMSDRRCCCCCSKLRRDVVRTFEQVQCVVLVERNLMLNRRRYLEMEYEGEGYRECLGEGQNFVVIVRKESPIRLHCLRLVKGSS